MLSSGCKFAIALTMAAVYAFTILFLGQSATHAQVANGSGDSFNNCSSGSGDPNVVSPGTHRPVVIENEPQCDLCRGRGINQCQTEDHPGCKCDGECGLYGDCCADHPLCEQPDNTLETSVFASMECSTVYHSQYSTIYAETYWMVARCPEPVGHFGADFQELTTECSFGSTAPVTDQETGIIYKNQFCAGCHSVNSFVRWSFTYSCREEFMELLSMESVPVNSLLEYCVPCRYVIPSSVYENTTRDVLAPRRCVVHVSTCLSYKQYLVSPEQSLLLSEDQFENAVYHCYNDPYNAIGAFVMRRGQIAWNVYRNIHCALCNGAAIPDSNQCTQYSSLFIPDLCQQSTLNFRPGTGTVPQKVTFGLLLDINRDGATTIATTETISSVTKLSTACRDNEVFDPSFGGCRQIICPPGYTASRGSCVITQSLLPPEGIAPNQTRISHPDQRLVNPDSGIDPDDHEYEKSTRTMAPTTMDSDATPTAYCYLVTLRKGHDNFTIVGNDSVVYGGVTVTVVAFDDSHNPIICSVLTTNDSASHTHRSYHQKIKQIAPGVFIVPSLLLDLITISWQLFLRKLHSVHGSVIINLALTFLLSDVVLLAIHHSQSSLDIIYFLWHTCSLAVAGWLCIYIVHISLALRKSTNSRIIGLTSCQKTTLVCMYLTFAWGPAVVVALIKNEMYGKWGSCPRGSSKILCESMPSSLTFFIVPVLVAVVLCALLCAVVSVKAIKSPQPLDKNIMYRFYIFLVLLTTFSLGWIFGFVNLLSPLSLVSAIAFLVFLSLKLATVLFFFFGLVFSERTRRVLQKLFGRRNKIHPGPQIAHEPPQIRIEEPTSAAVGDKLHPT